MRVYGIADEPSGFPTVCRCRRATALTVGRRYCDDHGSPWNPKHEVGRSQGRALGFPSFRFKIPKPVGKSEHPGICIEKDLLARGTDVADHE